MNATTTKDADHSPVSLPAGSYDYDKLKAKLEPVTTAKPEQRDAKIAAALEGASNDEQAKTRDNRAMAGMKFVEREQVLVEGQDDLEGVKAGEVKVKETIQVFDRKEADRAAKAEEAEASTPTAPEVPVASKGK